MAKVKILNSCAGSGLSFYSGQIVEITQQNTDVINSKLRHGTAILLEEEKKKDVAESRGSNENTNILHDAPIKRKGRKSINDADRRGIL